jgi:hypothetical protein
MPERGPSRRGLTIRSLVLGLGLVALVSLGAPYSIWMVGSSEMTWSYFPIIAGAPFAALVLVNALAGRWFPDRVLTAGELVVILSMGLVVTGIPIFVVGTLLAIISSPYYAATPENDWAGYIHPYLPNWAIPSPEGEAMRWFYEGAPSGQPLPLHAWAGPLFWWLSLILCVYFVCFCLVVILRKQWVVHERLVFPLTEMPRLLIEDGGSGVLRAKTFWIGCCVPLVIILFNVISFFYPGFPQIAITQAISFQVSRDFPAMYLMLYLPVTGFMFMASSSISFSIWFFYLVAVLQEGITNRIGYDVTHPDAFVWGMQSLSWQGWGTFTAMVLWSLWMGREHLRAVYRRVFRGGHEVDDHDEMLSYRAAVFGLIAGVLYMLGWLCAAGMSVHVALLFVFGVLVAYMGITRLVVQAGMYYLTTPVGGQAFALAITGTRLGPNNLVSLAMNYAWFGDVQSVFMPSAANAAKLNEWCGSRRGLGVAMGLAVVAGFVITIYFVLYLSYRYGAGNFHSWYFAAGGGAGGMAFDGVVRQVNDPWGTDWNKLSYYGIGLALYSVLAMCQYRFHWWPLHPVGLVTAPLWMTRLIVLSVFLGWLFKSVILRYGGITLYRQARPFFIGIIVGFFLGVALSYLVDHIWFFGLGHYILNG